MHHYSAITDNLKADRKADRLRSPFIVNDPFSKKADKVGLDDGELICNYADDAVALIDIRKDLQKEVDALIGEESAPKIGITRFKNWGKTNEALLLLAKPTTKEQVVAVVKGVRNLNEKKAVKVNYMPQYNNICSMCVLSGISPPTFHVYLASIHLSGGDWHGRLLPHVVFHFS